MNVVSWILPIADHFLSSATSRRPPYPSWKLDLFKSRQHIEDKMLSFRVGTNKLLFVPDIRKWKPIILSQMNCVRISRNCPRDRNVTIEVDLCFYEFVLRNPLWSEHEITFTPVRTQSTKWNRSKSCSYPNPRLIFSLTTGQPSPSFIFITFCFIYYRMDNVIYLQKGGRGQQRVVWWSSCPTVKGSETATFLWVNRVADRLNATGD